MPTKHQVRGMLLEESVLALLRAAGYDVVLAAGTDPTLRSGPAGLVVRGRGTDHQIDAIADFRLAQPFSHPQRLLIEAKFFDEDKVVGLNIVRNTVGVLKDVSEFWVRSGRGVARRRYHYQAAILAANEFSANAQDYAFAHDVYLFPLARSVFFQPIIDSIRRSVDVESDEDYSGVSLRQMRQAVRTQLNSPEEDGYYAGRQQDAWLGRVFAAHAGLRRSLVGVVARSLPLFLVPRDPRISTQLGDRTNVTIHFNDFAQRRG
jgi:hypothetical protein